MLGKNHGTGSVFRCKAQDSGDQQTTPRLSMNAAAKSSDRSEFTRILLPKKQHLSR